MEFEFDPQKSDINKAKHGIGFVEAQKLWKSKVVLLSAKDRLEKRYLAIGAMDSKYWAALSPIAERRFGLLVSAGPRVRRSRSMKKSQPEPTRAKNLEEKFDRGEEVLDYFDLPKARVIKPRSALSGTKQKFAYPPKSNARGAVVREKSADYREDRKASRP